MKRQFLIYITTGDLFPAEHTVCNSGLEHAYQDCRQAYLENDEHRCAILRLPEYLLYDDATIRRNLNLEKVQTKG